MVIKFCRAMGWCWCWPKRRLEDGYDLEHFLNLRLPIFWVMGPPGCGKTTIATALTQASNYRLVRVSQIIKDEIEKNEWRGKTIAAFTEGDKACPNEIVLNLLKEVFYLTCDDSEGYIIDGFPLDLLQGKQFEFEICKVFIIIYPTLPVDVYFQRFLEQGGSIEDKSRVKARHREGSRACQEIYRHYEQKTLKCVTKHKTELLVNALVGDLSRYFGYKFQPIAEQEKLIE
ncbi:putative AAA domain protein [Trypoxylus dichotomus]